VTDEERLLRRAYDAFDARDIDAALACAHADVDWPNGDEGRIVVDVHQVVRDPAGNLVSEIHASRWPDRADGH